MATREEVLRYVYQVTGDDDLAAVAKQLHALGDVSGETEKDIQALVDELANIARAKAATQEFQALRTSVIELGREYQQAKERATVLGKALAETDGPTKKQQRDFDKARASLEKYGAQIAEGKTKLAGLRDTLDAQGVSVRKLGEADDVLARNRKAATGQLEGLLTQEKNARRSADELAQAQERAAAASARFSARVKSAGSTFARLGGEAKQLVGTLGRITGVAGLVSGVLATLGGLRVFGSAVESAKQFEQTITQVGALAGANAEQLKALTAAANDAGAAYGVGAKETADALGELVRASGDADAAIAQLPATLALAKAGGLGLADAATIVVQTLSQFGLEASDAGHAADVLTKVANDTTAGIADLGEALTYAAPVAAQLGLSIEDTTAAIGALSQQGFRGSLAGTALRQTFIQLLTPTSSFNKKLQDLGINTKDFNEVLAALAKAGDKGRDAILSLGNRAAPAILALVNNGRASLGDLRASLQDVQGEAQTTAQAFTENFAGAAGKLGSALDKLRRSIVERGLGPIKDAFEEAAVKIRAFIDTQGFDDLATAVQDFSAKAVAAFKDFIGNIDFTDASRRITEFLNGAGKKLGSAFETIGAAAKYTVTAVTAVGVAFDAIKGTIESVASGLAAIAQAGASLTDKLAGPLATLTDKLGLTSGAADRLHNAVGGLGAVSEEFGNRAKANFDKVSAAVDDSAVAAENAKSKLDDLSNAAGAHKPPLDALGGSFNAVSGEIEKTGIKLDITRKLLSQTEDGFPGLTRSLDDAATSSEHFAASQQDTASAVDASKEAADALAAAYKNLGITSQATLQKSAADAAASVGIITKAYEKGKASIEDVRRAQDAYAKTAQDAGQRVAEAAKTQTQATDSAADSIGRLSKSMSDAEVAAVNAAYGLINVRDAADAAGSSAEQSGQEISAAGGAAIATYLQLREEFRKTSDAAATLYEKITKSLFLTPTGNTLLDSDVTGIAKFSQAASDAVKVVQDKIDEARQHVADLAAHYGNLSDAAAQSFIRQVGNIDSAIVRMRSYANNVSASRVDLELLGDADLAPLIKAERAAVDKLREIKAQALAAQQQLEEMGRSLQDQIDAAQGNDKAVEDRRYQDQLDQLKQLADQAGNLNSQEYNADVNRARELHQLKLQQIEEEAQARAQANQQASNNASSASNASQPTTTTTSSNTGSAAGGLVVNVNVDKLLSTDPEALDKLGRLLLPVFHRLAALRR